MERLAPNLSLIAIARVCLPRWRKQLRKSIVTSRARPLLMRRYSYCYLSICSPLPPSPLPLPQAEKCNPPLEEGDQLLYINSKSVTHCRHEEVIGMIRASREQSPCELILIVKPKDLSRTNPIVRSVLIDMYMYMLSWQSTRSREQSVVGSNPT